MAKDRLKRGGMADSGEKIRLRITGDKVKAIRIRITETTLTVNSFCT